jgi:hypothetical protein
LPRLFLTLPVGTTRLARGENAGAGSFVRTHIPVVHEEVSGAEPVAIEIDDR